MRRHLRGESKRSIAKILAIDRRTISKLLAEAAKRRQQGDDALLREIGPIRAPRPSKLDPHKDFIAKRLADHPDLKATRLLEDLQERGFDGRYTIVREYLKRVQPKPVREPDKRVEHRCGQQAQADWSEYELIDGSKFNAWGTVLCFSRFPYEKFTTDRRQVTVFRQLDATFESFGGVPDEVVFDSMPGIVDRWEMDEPILNLRAVDFAAYYGFSLHIAPRGQGQYKGVIERLFRTTEEGPLNGRDFRSVEQANALLAQWLHKYVRRPHGTTRRPPIELLDQERALLSPLPAHPYDTRDLAYRIVDGYGCIQFETNSYTVPPSYVGRWVYVRADEGTVEVFDGQANCLATHERRPPGAHLDAYLPEHRPKRKPVSWDLLFGRFAEWGDVALEFAQQVKARKRFGRPQLVAILDLQRTYSTHDIVTAIRHATRYCAFDAQSLTRVLQATATSRSLEDQFADRIRRRLREAMASNPIQQRPVEEYARILGTTASNAPGQELTYGKHPENPEESEQT